MIAPYAHAREHLDDVLALVTKLLERQIVAHWEFGLLPRTQDRYGGTYLTAQDVRGLFAGGAAGTVEGMHELRALDAALAAHGDRLLRRTEATRDAGDELPLDRLRRSCGLTDTEERALWIALAAELVPTTRQLLRYLANDPARAQLDVGLLDALIYAAPGARARLLDELGPTSRLLRLRLLEPGGATRGEAFTLRPLRIAPRVVELAHGVVRLDPAVASVAELIAPHALDELLVEPTLRRQIDGLIARAVDPSPTSSGRLAPGVLVSGRTGAGRRSILVAAALAAGHDSILIRSRELPRELEAFTDTVRALLREAELLHALPIFVDVEALAEQDGPESVRAWRLDALLRGWPGAIAATSGAGETLPISLERGLVRVDLGPMPEALREQLWRRGLDGAPLAPDLDCARIAGRYAATPGTILAAASAARAIALARGDALTDADVHTGLRSATDEQFALGSRVTRRQSWDDLVLPDDVADTLREFVARIRHRKRVYEDWGFARKMARGLGVSALFAGPPGTGKTMVAGIIADQLGLDLYQIDLSRVVSKYIGETEKNLARVFDAAETGHAILLFDEADALFARRGEVKSSVDRYANLEVNYLLQRMESFDGITILTTNFATSIDDAFRRRLSLRLEFPMPELDERERLWQAMLPAEAERAGDIDFQTLARRFEMSGGYIRNAVLRAAFLAAEEHHPIGFVHLKRAAELEYAAMGKVG